jgi:3',5'-cyclic AMP phosphodiesterase CpdA
VEHLNRLDPRPDVVLITGDLVDTGKLEEYVLFRRLIASFAMPVYVIPGNHDEREAMRQALSDHYYLPKSGEFLHYVIDDYAIRLIGLDTTMPDQPRGELCVRRLTWLDERLSEASERPTVLFMHHPPFLTGIRHMDRQNCRNGDALGAIIHKPYDYFAAMSTERFRLSST